MSSKAVYIVSQFCLNDLCSSHCLAGQSARSVMLPKVQMNNLDQPTEIPISVVASARMVASDHNSIVTERLAVYEAPRRNSEVEAQANTQYRLTRGPRRHAVMIGQLSALRRSRHGNASYAKQFTRSFDCQVSNHHPLHTMSTDHC